MPLVSWLIPVKNGMPYIREALQSIESQTFLDHEVLVWDNGSEDGTLDEIIRWIPERLNGTIFTGVNLSVGGALARLVELSRSTFCARIDADDVAQPERLELQVAYMLANPRIGIVGSWLRAIDEKGRPTGIIFEYPVHHRDIVNSFLVRNPIGHPGVLFRRQAVIDAGNYNRNIILEDYELWLRLTQYWRAANIADCLTSYRLHATSTMAKLKKVQSIENLFTESLVVHGSSLYGISAVEVAELRARSHPFAFLAFVRILKFQYSSCHDFSLAEIVNIELCKGLLELSSEKDIVSRIIFSTVTGGISSLFCQFRKIFPLVLRKLPGYGCFRSLFYWLRWYFAFYFWRQRQCSKCRFGPGMVFSGDQFGFERIKLGVNTLFERDNTIWISQSNSDGSPRLIIGDNVFLGRGVYLGAHDLVEIGSNSMIGAYSYIISANHAFSSCHELIRDQGFIGAPISVEADVWIGTHVIILPGVHVGKGSVIGAGSVVTKSIPPMEVWAGNPAKFVRSRM